MRSIHTCVLFLGLAGPGAAQGKLSLGISLGASAFSTAARGLADNGDELAFSPYRPTMSGLHASYGRCLRAELGIRVGSPGLAARGVPSEETEAGLLLVTENAYHVYGAAAGASLRLIRLRDGPTLRGSLSVTLDRWTAPDSPARVVPGGQAGLALEVGLTRSLTARAEGELGVSASPFRTEDLPDGYRQETTWRKTLAVALAWRP